MLTACMSFGMQSRIHPLYTSKGLGGGASSTPSLQRQQHHSVWGQCHVHTWVSVQPQSFLLVKAFQSYACFDRRQSYTRVRPRGNASSKRQGLMGTASCLKSVRISMMNPQSEWCIGRCEYLFRKKPNGKCTANHNQIPQR